MSEEQNNEEAVQVTENRRFLIFHLGGQVFGTPLLDIREVIEYQTPKPIPNTVQSYKGVINIRGEVIGSIDLRVRFGYPEEHNSRTSMMVFETSEGPLAAIADAMDGVIAIANEAIDANPRIESKVPLKHLLGIAKNKNDLITLIDLRKILESSDIITIKNTLNSAA